MKKFFTLLLVASLATAEFSPVHAAGKNHGVNPGTGTIVNIIKTLQWTAVVLTTGVILYTQFIQSDTPHQVSPTPCPLVPAFGDGLVSMTGNPLNGTLVNGECKATLPVDCGIQNSNGEFNPGYLSSTILHIGNEAARQAYACLPVPCPTELLTPNSQTLYGTLQKNGTCFVPDNTPCEVHPGLNGVTVEQVCVSKSLLETFWFVVSDSMKNAIGLNQ